MTIFQIIQNETPGRVYEDAKKRNRVKRWFCVDWGILDIGGKGKKTEKIFKKRLAKSWILDYTKKACESLPQALLMLKNNAMTQEVAELSGNFCRELSGPEPGEGILALLFWVKNNETHGNVFRSKPSDRLRSEREPANSREHLKKEARQALVQHSENVRKTRRNNQWAVRKSESS